MLTPGGIETGKGSVPPTRPLARVQPVARDPLDRTEAQRSARADGGATRPAQGPPSGGTDPYTGTSSGTDITNVSTYYH